MHAHTTLESLLGRYTIVANAGGISHIQPEGSAKLPPPSATPSPAAAAHAQRGRRALEAYFAGAKTAFDDLTLVADGSEFQRTVWDALCQIPHGQTESYGALATRIGRPGAARAVGRANHDNPIGIAIPCHRVIGTRGALTGYAGGLQRKHWLLTHEGAISELPLRGAGLAKPSQRPPCKTKGHSGSHP